MHRWVPILAAAAVLAPPAMAEDVKVQAFAVPAGAHPHDVAPAPDGAVWYTAQRQGAPLAGSTPRPAQPCT